MSPALSAFTWPSPGAYLRRNRLVYPFTEHAAFEVLFQFQPTLPQNR
jgi:hypothetical protein